MTKLPADLIERLRADGWMIAVHNDYRQNGKPHTFYLLTHPSGVWAKGEGETDKYALLEAACQAQERLAPAAPPAENGRTSASRYCPACGQHKDIMPAENGIVAQRDKAMARIAELEAEVERLRSRKDEAYHERNLVVAALAKLFPAGTRRTDIPDWDPEWHGCVYIDLPTGQVSWHYHNSEAYLFMALPPYTAPWDGHDTSEKYHRLVSLEATPRPDPSQEESPNA